MNKRIPASDLNAGLRRIHRQGRKAFAKTRKATNATWLHEWRKKAKYLANAVVLLGDAPSTAVAATAKRAERIADWLGDDHDLFVLTQQLRFWPAATSKERLRSLIDDRRIRLQRKAFRCGKRLYAKKRRQAFKRDNSCSN